MSEQSKQTLQHQDDKRMVMGCAFLEPYERVYPPHIYKPDFCVSPFERQLQIKPLFRKSILQQPQAKQPTMQIDDEEEQIYDDVEPQQEEENKVHPQSCLQCFVSSSGRCDDYLTFVTENLSVPIENIGHHIYEHAVLYAINALLVEDEKWIIPPIQKVEKIHFYTQCIHRCGAYIMGNDMLFAKKMYTEAQSNRDICLKTHKSSIVKPYSVATCHYFASPDGIAFVYIYIYIVLYFVSYIFWLYRYNWLCIALYAIQHVMEPLYFSG